VRAEKGLLARIIEEEAKTAEITLPPVLRGRIGEAAAASWKRDDLAIKREIIRLIADIRIAPAGKGRRGIPVRERIATWHWLLGPG
jgi:site-specific DNA recombinase